MNSQNNIESSSGAVGTGFPRRRLIFLTTAALAGSVGVGAALWRYTPDSVSLQADAAAVQNFWGLNLETPSGGSLAMSTFKGRPLLINFWATWCPPCIEELPLLDAFFKENSTNGWQVLAIAIDKPSAVRDFLSRKPLGFPVVMGGLSGSELGKSLGNAAGGLPFSVVLSSDGKVSKRKIGKLYASDLSLWRAVK